MATSKGSVLSPHCACMAGLFPSEPTARNEPLWPYGFHISLESYLAILCTVLGAQYKGEVHSAGGTVQGKCTVLEAQYNTEIPKVDYLVKGTF